MIIKLYDKYGGKCYIRKLKEKFRKYNISIKFRSKILVKNFKYKV